MPTHSIEYHQANNAEKQRFGRYHSDAPDDMTSKPVTQKSKSRKLLILG